MDKIKQYAKALAAFLAVFSGFAAALAASPELRAVFPASWIAVLSAIGAAGAIGGLVAGIGNAFTPGQLAKAAAEVAPQVAQQASSAVQAAVAQAANDLPAPARDAVAQVATQAGSVVDQVIRDFQIRTH